MRCRSVFAAKERASTNPLRFTKRSRFSYGMVIMGYTHYWTQKRAFSDAEWKLILGEAKRIIAKAARGHYYTGKEDNRLGERLGTRWTRLRREGRVAHLPSP